VRDLRPQGGGLLAFKTTGRVYYHFPVEKSLPFVPKEEGKLTNPGLIRGVHSEKGKFLARVREFYGRCEKPTLICEEKRRGTRFQ